MPTTPLPHQAQHGDARMREAVCVMPGRARLECFGCPALHCAFNVQPFADLEETLEVACNAAELLRTNRIWVLSDGASVSGRALYDGLGGVPEGELLARLYEARDAFSKNLATEGAMAGVLGADTAAQVARMRMTGTNSPNSLNAFLERVIARQSLIGEPIEEGAQRHTHAILPDSLVGGPS